MQPLREKRLRQRLSQETFAAQIGWSVPALSRVERGLPVGDRLIVRLAEAFKISITDAELLCVPGGNKQWKCN